MTAPTPEAALHLPATRPWLGCTPVFVALRYLLKKKLSYLAIVGVMLSVATLIVVMSVFTGFHLRLTGAIRGYLSDLTVRPLRGKLYGLEDWPSWVEQVRQVEHVKGVAPFIESFALLRLPGTEDMSHVFLRGIHPQLEAQVTEMASYMSVGKLDDLDKTYANPDDPQGRRLNACIVGAQFRGFTGDWPVFDASKLDVKPGYVVLVTATADLERRLAMFAVNGLFQTTYYDYDSKFVITGLQSAMDLVKSQGAVTGLSVRLDDYKNAEQVRARLRERLSPGAVLRTVGDGAAVTRAALSADGLHAAGLTRPGEIVLWKTDAGTQGRVGAPRPGSPSAVALSPRGELVLVGYEDGGAVMVKSDTGEEQFAVPAAGSGVRSACFSDVWTFALAHEDGTVGLWDADGKLQVASLKGHSGAVNSVAFDGVGERLVTGGQDGTVRLWQADATGRELLVLRSPSGRPVTAAAVSMDGMTVVAGDADGGMAIWDTRSGKPSAYWHGHRTAVQAVAFGGQPNEVVSAASEGMHFWIAQPAGELTSLREYHVAAADDAPFQAAVIRPDGQAVLTVGQGGAVRVRYSGPPFSVITWEEQQKTFLSAVRMERFLQCLIISLILVVAEFFIFAIVTTVVNERRRDIGILKAIGFTQGQICQVFLIVGLAIGVLGGLLGVGAGILFADNINGIREVLRQATGFDPFPPDIYYFTEVPAHVGYLTPILSAAGAIACSLLFSIFPALRAARMDPVETLRYE
jgi:ABC-type lipoprotein release transport system permease subunit/WD40 repeat protein